MDSAAAGRKRSALLTTLTKSLQLGLNIGYWLFAAQTAFGQGVVNVDFSRDISAQNPGGNPAPVLYTGTGPSSDLGTTWNDLRVPLSISGDQGADTIANPIQFNNLDASDGTTTTIDLELTSGFFRAFNGSPAASSATIAALQNERVFSNSGNLATLTLKGLDPARQYDLYLINSGSFATAYTIGATSKTASGNSFDGDWTDGVEHAYFAAVSPDASGEIAIGIQDSSAPINSFGTISGIQIVPLNTQPVNFLYPNSASSNGGQFNASYPPDNLMSDGFTSPGDTIDTISDYFAAGNNYATASGTTVNFDITFDFTTPTSINGMHVWNYVYRNGASGLSSPSSGVNTYTLTFYDAPSGAGAVIGTPSSGNLAPASFNALNTAESIDFGTTFPSVRSAVLHVTSNHGATTFTGINELAFNGVAEGTNIASFTSSAGFVQRPATPTLSWQVNGNPSTLEIQPGIGDVLPFTDSNGAGSIAVSPIGAQTYTLIADGSVQATLTVIGLPTREKLHVYLLIGQSNMAGSGRDFDPALDAPHPRVLKFGSRDGLEESFNSGGHPLTALSNGGTNAIGMGVEFGKASVAAQTDPDLVVCLVNHAIGASAIQWWAPGIVDNKQTNPQTGQNYILYDEALTRLNDIAPYGRLKGVLWHQGEYNANLNTNPDSDPNGYAARLATLVDHLRADTGDPSLPFVCGKFVPTSWINASGQTITYNGLPNRAIVESALEALPTQRSNTRCVDNAGLRGLDNEQIHFDAHSQRLLGQRYAAELIALRADPFLLYLGGFFTPAELGQPTFTNPESDVDADGLPALIEFALLTDPSRPDGLERVTGGKVTLLGQGEFQTISYRHRTDIPNLQTKVQVSTDLTTWSTNLDGQAPLTVPVGLPVDHGDGTQTTTVRSTTALSPATQRLFLRLHVTLE